MRFASLGSGSEGNALLVEAGGALHGRVAFRVMVDCGFGLREAERRLARLDCPASSIAGILVTHEHGDHAGPHDGMVVDDEQPDHRGTTSRSVVPAPGPVSTSTAPPISAARACTPSSPKPARTPSGSKPSPSSRTVSTTACGSS